MDTTTLTDKNINELDVRELINVFLIERKEPIQFKFHEVRTTLSITLEGIESSLKKLSLRNVLPVIGIFSVFDMIGTSFNHKEKTTNANSSIKRSLNLFINSVLSNDDIKALYALRNSIVHNSSLASKSKFKNNENYFFRYNSTLNVLLKHSVEKWDGNFNSLDGNQDKFTTEINIFKLHELMKECLNNVRELNKQDKINLRYSGPLEFYYHYFRSVKNKLSDKEIENLKPRFEEKKELIEKHIEDYSTFTILLLGENDSYSSTEDKNEFIIASHPDYLIMSELKKYLDWEFNSNNKCSRDLALFYTRSELNSSKYFIKIIVE